MVTYDFYKNTYLGRKIQETEFPYIVARAEDYVACLERQYQVIPVTANSRDMAVCAAADQMRDEQKQKNVSAATVGNVSIRYFEGNTYGKLLRSVMPYLDIHRGVG